MAKRSGRMCTSLVGKCWGEPGRANLFEARKKLIKMQAKKLFKYTKRWSKTAEVSSENYQRGLKTCYVISVVRFVGIWDIMSQQKKLNLLKVSESLRRL